MFRSPSWSPNRSKSATTAPSSEFGCSATGAASCVVGVVPSSDDTAFGEAGIGTITRSGSDPIVVAGSASLGLSGGGSTRSLGPDEVASEVAAGLLPCRLCGSLPFGVEAIAQSEPGLCLSARGPSPSASGTEPLCSGTKPVCSGTQPECGRTDVYKGAFAFVVVVKCPLLLFGC